MKKIMMVFDTPEEAMRICPVIQKLKQMEYKPVVLIPKQVETAGIMEQVLALFEVEPTHILSVDLEPQTLNQLTAYALNELARIVKHEKIDRTFVCGSTKIAFIAALASYYNGVPVTQAQTGEGEEAAAFLGKSTEALMAPLVTNHVVLGLETALEKAADQYVHNMPIDNYDTQKIILFDYQGKSNQRQILEKSFQAIKQITDIYKEVIFIIPIKLTTLVMELANKILKGQKQVYFVKPLNVLEYQSFMTRAWLVMTDHYNSLEMAQILQLPVLIMEGPRNKNSHDNYGVGTVIRFSKVQITEWIERLLMDRGFYEEIARRPSPNKKIQTIEEMIESFVQK
ncbi:hypothetical protein HCJ46_06630 [Listeria booriae]|uniref:UDP-N-acetylglucosamine 2-epimerase n=1 Tax=Listeria booriae TaxID=1552123 RepID=UPI0016241F83|nr:UDP-N-acetylglucosamine 2-epimerase [Listeria booriae]MBC1918424.1 hypothetical protein [Listeria booriae]